MPVTARMRGMLEQKLDGVLEQPLLDLATDVSGDMVTLCAIPSGFWPGSTSHPSCAESITRKRRKRTCGRKPLASFSVE